jgi:drug/metabolite transporter (DMT)-like permease
VAQARLEVRERDPHRARERPGARRGPPLLAWVALGIVYVLWGSTYLGIRVTVETIPPLFMAGARFLIAGAVLFPLAWWRGERERLGPAQWGAAAVVGTMLLTIANAAVGWAEQTVPSGLAALVVATVPLWLVLLDRWFNGARLGWIGVLGISLGFAGVALLVRPSGANHVDLVGVGVIIAAALSWAGGSLYAKRAPLPGNALLGAGMEMLCGGGLLILASIVTGEVARLDLGQVSTRSLAAWAWLVVAGSIVAYSAYAYILKALPTATVATYAYVNPVIAVILGVVVLDEPLTAQALVAGAAIVAAVALIVTGQRHDHHPAEDPDILDVHDRRRFDRRAADRAS